MFSISKESSIKKSLSPSSASYEIGFFTDVKGVQNSAKNKVKFEFLFT
jgi:hypothetical protein